MDCPTCGYSNAPDAVVCAQCGHDLRGETPTVARLAATPAPGAPDAPPALPYSPTSAPAPGHDPARVAAGATPPPAPPRRGTLVRNVLLASGLLGLLVVVAGAFLLFQALNRPNVSAARLLPPETYGYLSIAAQP